jgi:[acyl-carrier-protein] S-malonyltransferase
MSSSHSTCAFLFPGQGSQSIGMLADLAQDFPCIQETYAIASAQLGYDLWQLVQAGPEADLHQTEHTQPALLAGGVAMFEVWKTKHGALPAFMAGHSLGEYTALVCAGALDYADAISLVALRGRFMQAAVKAGEGAMAAIVGLTEEQVQQICITSAAGAVLSPANFNAIGQTVLAGETAAIERAIAHAKQLGAKIAKQIPVSVPSHCALMHPAAEQLAAYLENVQIHPTQIPVIRNVDARPHQDPAQIRAALVKQLYNPVRWVETIQWLAAEGVQQFIECGPGKVLAGLNKRIVPALKTVSIGTKEGVLQALAPAFE